MQQPTATAPPAQAQQAPLAKLRTAALADLLPLLMFSGAAATTVAAAADPADALDRLDQAGLHTEAARLIAHALPRREAVWWACMCARHTTPADLPPADLRALEAAEAWVFRGEDADRRAGFDHAQEASFGTPEAWAAVAAFWCGDSMAPAGQAAVPPPPRLAGTAVAGSIILAAVRDPAARRAARLVRFIEAGRAIAGGGSGRLAHEDA